MAGVLIISPIEELTVFTVPEIWMQLPEDLRNDRAWWTFIQAALMQENVVMMGPPTNLDWVWAREPGDLDGVVLRHPCDECNLSLHQTQEWLENRPEGEVAVFLQFTQRYLEHPIAAARRFLAHGEFSTTVRIEEP